MWARGKVDAWLMRDIRRLRNINSRNSLAFQPFSWQKGSASCIPSSRAFCKHCRLVNNVVTCWISHKTSEGIRSTDKLLFLTHADTRATCCTMESPSAQRWRAEKKLFKLRKMCKLNLWVCGRLMWKANSQPSLLTMRFRMWWSFYRVVAGQSLNPLQSGDFNEWWAVSLSIDNRTSCCSN